MAGQTKSEIRALLDEAGLTPQHRFGQNFLIDLNLMRKLVSAAELSRGDFVIEVGPGTGSLTELILESGAAVLAIEIDRGLQRVLEARFGGEPRFTLIRNDAMAGKNALNCELSDQLESQSRSGQSCKLVANLPYQIATPLLMELLISHPIVSLMVCTIQKEVGQKLSAQLGDPEYGAPAIIAQSVCTIETIAALPPSAFWPAPEVDSVMLRIRRRSELPRAVDEIRRFADFVRRSFQQRRKTLRRIARDWSVDAPERIFDVGGVNPGFRPEQISIPAWQLLYSAYSSAPRRSRE